MASTANFGWSKPVVGGSAGTWGTELNTLFDDIDTDLNAVKSTADSALPLAGGVLTGEVEILTERYTTVNKGNLSGAVEFDIDTANVFYGTVTGNITSMSIVGEPSSGKAAFLTLELTNGGAFTVTWDPAIIWDGAAEPTLQSSGVDIVILYTRDGGTTWRGMHSGTFNS